MEYLSGVRGSGVFGSAPALRSISVWSGEYLTAVISVSALGSAPRCRRSEVIWELDLYEHTMECRRCSVFGCVRNFCTSGSEPALIDSINADEAAEEHWDDRVRVKAEIED